MSNLTFIEQDETCHPERLVLQGTFASSKPSPLLSSTALFGFAMTAFTGNVFFYYFTASLIFILKTF